MVNNRVFCSRTMLCVSSQQTQNGPVVLDASKEWGKWGCCRICPDKHFFPDVDQAFGAVPVGKPAAPPMAAGPSPPAAADGAQGQQAQGAQGDAGEGKLAWLCYIKPQT